MPILSKKYKLVCNSAWTDYPINPIVSACCRRNAEELSFIFDVIEAPEFFRLENHHDGDPCWQDSCVEIFIASPKLGGYFNFETNALCRSLAEFGSGRDNRRRFSPEEYCALRRSVLVEPHRTPDNNIHWSVQINISTEKLAIGDFDPVVGNLYKCASFAPSPNYLMAFPIAAPKPDFHRPEYFKNIFL